VSTANAATAPLLVVAIGNASRGDDALGPALAARLSESGAFDAGAAELIEAYQLQIEDVMSLHGRRGLLFIDAARGPSAQGVALQPLAPADAPNTFTHALAPAALLALYRRVLECEPPPAWLLSIDGEAFELGAPLSQAAAARLLPALELARAWLAARSVTDRGEVPHRRVALPSA
jgi:hydrogenase maturation protease